MVSRDPVPLAEAVATLRAHWTRRAVIMAAMHWWAAMIVAVQLWAETGIGVFLLAAVGFLVLSWVWTLPLALGVR